MVIVNSFSDRMLRAIDEKESYVIVGLDPNVDFIPEHLKRRYLDKYGDSFEAVGAAFLEFDKRLIDALHPLLSAAKLNIAFYECYQGPGIRAFAEAILYARSKGLQVLEDGKRDEVEETAKKYSEGHLGRVKLLSGERVPSYDLDCLTVNSYLMTDSIGQFRNDVIAHKKGIQVLDKTSNPSATELQDEKLQSGLKVCEHVAKYIDKWGEGTEGEEGWKSVGAVVGLTYASVDGPSLRGFMPRSLWLSPGIGLKQKKQQGGKPEDVPFLLGNDGRGAFVNSSRGIIAAWKEPEYFDKYGDEKFEFAARDAAIDMDERINDAVVKAHKSRW